MSRTQINKPTKTQKTSKSKKFVYAFGKTTDGNTTMRELLGGKGANLAEMASIGLPVPPGFTISTEVCTYYYDHEQRYPQALRQSVADSVKNVEKQLNK